jgi:hypothetical protein
MKGHWECKQHGKDCKSYAKFWAEELNNANVEPNNLDYHYATNEIIGTEDVYKVLKWVQGKNLKPNEEPRPKGRGI